jgi:hypothetical protein
MQPVSNMDRANALADAPRDHLYRLLTERCCGGLKLPLRLVSLGDTHT